MTADRKHEFKCSMCHQEFLHWKLDLLCASVNDHNLHQHKNIYCAWWAPSTIVFSNFYTGPDKISEDRIQADHPNIKPEYAKRWGTAENSAHPFAITKQDREFLEAVHVVWEE